MPVSNNEVEKMFDEFADLLEIKGENQFRVRAYRNAARTVGGLSGDIDKMVARGERLSSFTGIGKDLENKIVQIVKAGRFELLEDLKKEMPEGLVQIMRVFGLGPRRIKTLHEKLGIKTPEELEAAARNGRIKELPGFGRKTEQSIIEGLGRIRSTEGRFKLQLADRAAGLLLEYLKAEKTVRQAVIAGSYRRCRETVKDLDVLVTCDKGSRVMDHFMNYDNVEKVIARGDTKSSVLLRSGLQVDLRLVPQESYGAALHYFTGSKSHNIAVRAMAVKKKLKINEYGVFSEDGRREKRLAGNTEEEVYNSVGLPWIDPELREDRGEIEAARQGRLPRLVKQEDIRGDLHTHTNRTDGKYSLEEMAAAAQRLGYEYMAVTDHSQRLTMAHGLKPADVKEQIRQIDRINSQSRGFRVLKGIEVDILEDGTLDLPDEILRELDVRVCSVHSKFNLPGKVQTERIIRAMDNPNFNILGHPTGRLINERPGYEVDMEKLIKAARERKCYLEINSYPDRLDLNDIYSKTARDNKVLVAINTDAHSLSDLDFMRFGLGQARRGWLEKKDVLNTCPLEELLRLLDRRR